MKYGRQIPISGMELSHVKNTIRMLKRSESKHEAIPLWIEIFEKELKRRKKPRDFELVGEMAQLHNQMMEDIDQVGDNIDMFEILHPDWGDRE